MVDILERARTRYRQRAWGDAYGGFAAADAQGELEPRDLDRFARAAYLTGHDAECHDAWARAVHGFLAVDEAEAAAACSFWLGMVLLLRGDRARGGAWVGRARRHVDELGRDCAVRGLLLIPTGLGRIEAGEPGDALPLFRDALELAERFDDPDLRALSRLASGQALVAMGDGEQAIEWLDDAMLTVEAEPVSAVAAGIVYCATILACQELLDLRRAQEWTIVLNRWCDAQPDLVPYRGQCLVHRSQLAQLRGDWAAAVVEADHACARLADPPGQPAIGMAHYQRAELHRLRGELAEAERAYRRASRWGRGPHPGLALLRLVQGRVDDASSAIRRVVAESQLPGERATVLAACVEIMLAASDVAAARAAADELADMSQARDAPLLRAMATQADGAVLLAEDEPTAAADALRAARATWEQLGAPYEAARVQVLLASACRRRGDADTADLHKAAAHEVFAAVGARPALAALRGAVRQRTPGAAAGLTAREVEVIRLVAAGLTNRAIADRLVISEKTVARHLNNVFTRLDLPNRAAATAYAYKHDLV